MPVAEVLERLSMEEIASWAAYEEACGELSNEKIEGLLSSLLEEVQFTNWILWEKFFTGETDDGKIVNVLGATPGDYVRRLPTEREEWRHLGPGHILSGRVDIQTYDRIYGETTDPVLKSYYVEHGAENHDPDIMPDDEEDGEAE